MIPRAQLRQQIRDARRRIIAGIEARNLATVEARRLVVLPELEPRSGSKPILMLRDDAGERWVFKAADPPLALAEQAAYRLRTLGERPCVPALATEIPLPDVGLASGVLKPFVELASDAELTIDTVRWTDLQRAVMLREHVWEWWLGDLDANAGQYALFGPERYPVKLDWDRALCPIRPGPPSRFDRYRPMLPNVRGFLYADWLENEIELDLHHLMIEARHIARLPSERVRRALVGQDASVVGDVLRRQRQAPREIERFVRDLLREKRELSGAPLGAEGVRVWRFWQRMLDALARGPAGDAGRSLLRAWRARVVRAHARPA